MTRLIWLTLLAVVTAAPAPAADPAAKRPNVLFLLADDQRADTIAAWGNPAIVTPHLDRLVGRGVSFRNAYCFGGNQAAVCVPSRAMMLTGRSWLHASPRLDRGEALLPELLRAGGYRTFLVGKWHNGEQSLRRAFPEARSVFLGGMEDHTKVPLVDVTGGQVVNRRRAGAFSSEAFADAAIEFLTSAPRDEPFYCYVAFTAPHDPRNPPEEYRKRYYENRPPLPKNFRPLPAFDNGYTKNLRDENLAGYPRTPEVIGEQLCEYYGLVTHLDEQVGRILTALQSSGHAGDTVVIYAADHGLALGSHGLLGKQSLYEHSMKAPLIVAGPGVPNGQSRDALVYLTDLFPTTLDLAGVKPPPTRNESRSLVPHLTDPSHPPRTALMLAFGEEMRAVRDGRMKLLVYPNIHHEELFDLQADPDELTNLAPDPDHATTLTRMRKLLEAEQSRHGDTLPLRATTPRPKAIDFTNYERKPDQWQPPWVVEKYFPKR